MSDSYALGYIAKWFAHEIAGNEVQIVGFDPPQEFVDRVVLELVRDPRLGWPDEQSARWFLEDLWSEDPEDGYPQPWIQAR